MTQTPHKLSFEEAWNSITIFYVDEELEREIDQEVDRLLRLAEQYGVTEKSIMGPDSLAALLREQEGALEFVLREVELSEEKFLRIISLLRQIGRIPVPLDREWTMQQIVRRVRTDPDFASVIARLLMDGVRDTELQAVIPRYYLEALNFREIAAGSVAARRRDFQRLVENCHYFINLRHLDLLEPIVLTYVPRKYFQKQS